MEDLVEELATEEEDLEDEHPQGGALDISEVRFSYRDGMEVLHGVDLQVNPGETLAIVGPLGAGKSTLGRLVAGINPPSSGAVNIGGAAVTRIPEKERHAVVSLVTQEHHVFVGSVTDNLRLAREDATGHRCARRWRPWKQAGCSICRKAWRQRSARAASC